MIIEKRDTAYKNVYMVTIEGLKASQLFKVIEMLEKLKDENFELVIEIGTEQGGSALLLKHYLQCEVHTWDITEWQPIAERQRIFKEHGINYHVEDCFEDEKLFKLLADKRKKILFCDGGHKGNEFNFFADKINKGDFIGGHDYFERVEDRSDDVWTTCELVYNDIRPAIEKYEMEQIYRDQSLKAVWALYKK